MHDLSVVCFLLRLHGLFSWQKHFLTISTFDRLYLKAGLKLLLVSSPGFEIVLSHSWHDWSWQLSEFIADDLKSSHKARMKRNHTVKFVPTWQTSKNAAVAFDFFLWFRANWNKHLLFCETCSLCTTAVVMGGTWHLKKVSSSETARPQQASWKAVEPGHYVCFLFIQVVTLST